MEVIGSGAFGVVYRAVWRGTIVAAKVITTPSTDRQNTTFREIQAFRYVCCHVLCFCLSLWHHTVLVYLATCLYLPPNKLHMYIHDFITDMFSIRMFYVCLELFRQRPALLS